MIRPCANKLLKGDWPQCQCLNAGEPLNGPAASALGHFTGRARRLTSRARCEAAEDVLWDHHSLNGVTFLGDAHVASPSPLLLCSSAACNDSILRSCHGRLLPSWSWFQSISIQIARIERKADGKQKEKCESLGSLRQVVQNRHRRAHRPQLRKQQNADGTLTMEG